MFPRFHAHDAQTIGIASRLAVLAGISCTGSALADLQWMNDASQYGYLCQYSLSDPALSAESCIPTSTTNGLAYLQNVHGSELGGISLTGLDYSSWMMTAEELRGPSYMNTNSSSGTNALGQTWGTQNYLSDLGVYPDRIRLEGTTLYTAEQIQEQYPEGDLPSWVQTGQHPTMSIMHQWLSGGAAIVLDLVYNPANPNDGHAVTLIGLDWIDANNDGIVDQNENAVLKVIDPLNPTEGSDGNIAVGPPKITEISVWDSANGMSFRYNQYLGDSIPYTNDFGMTEVGALSGAGAIFVIPSPGAAGVLIAGLVATGRRRRTC